MIIKKHKDTLHIIQALWPNIKAWLPLVEQYNGVTRAEMTQIIEQGLLSAKNWNNDNPFGTIENRSTRTMAVFLQSLDSSLKSKGKNGCLEYLPEQVATVLETLFEVKA